MNDCDIGLIIIDVFNRKQNNICIYWFEELGTNGATAKHPSTPNKEAQTESP